MESLPEVFPPGVDVYEAFKLIAQSAPDRVALIHGSQHISYGEMLRRVEGVASQLGGVQTPVGVLVSRSPATVIALFGILAAGATYCPIDPAFPLSRQQTMARSAGVTRLIRTAPGQADTPLLEDWFSPTLDLVQNDKEPPGSAPTVALDPATPAYILFTSGSSGVPKPVVVSRGALAHSVASLRHCFSLAASDRVLQFASLNWDTCFEEIFPVLSSGGTLVWHAHAASVSFPLILRALEAEGVTVWDVPTAMWHELVHHLVESKCSLPSCLRLIVIGGEPVRPQHLARWCALNTGSIRLVNTYGCTETVLVTHSVDLHGPKATFHDLDWGQQLAVPIGTALPHVRERVDAQGELWIGGTGLAGGYKNQPELTAEKFHWMPTDEGRERMFRTGDIVCRAADGNLTFLGRRDRELKVSGIRVHPDELETAISLFEGAAGVVAMGIEKLGRTVLCAYVVPKGGWHDERLTHELRVFLSSRLPTHLVPSQINVVPTLVYTSTGKLDRAGTHRKYASIVSHAGQVQPSLESP